MGNALAYLTEQLESWRKAGTYQRLRELESACEPIARFDGKEVINLASNNYLGLANHPKLVEAEIDAARRYGAGSGAVRTISGTMSLHMELERRIAAFKNVEACVVFQSGFAANAGTVVGDSRPRGSHHLRRAEPRQHHRRLPPLESEDPRLPASRRRARRRKTRRRSTRSAGHKLLITDGVFSMDGDIGALPQLTELAERYGAIMMVDDAHASGVLGRNGRGTVDHFDLHGRVDIQVGTLSKAVGVLGGYVCGSRDLIDFLYHRARPFLFSTSHPPAVAAACLAAFDILEQEPERIEKLWSNTRFFQDGLARERASPPAPARRPSRRSWSAKRPPRTHFPARSSTKACSPPASDTRPSPKAKRASAPS